MKINEVLNHSPWWSRTPPPGSSSSRVDDEDEEPEATHPTHHSKEVIPWLHQLASKAQKVYDNWEQDEEGYSEQYSVGGICDDIAERIAGHLSKNGIPCCTVNYSMGTNHTACLGNFIDGVYEIDISPHTYETGGGYTWKKIPNVVFEPGDISISCINKAMSDEEFYDSYTEG